MKKCTLSFHENPSCHLVIIGVTSAVHCFWQSSCHRKVDLGQLRNVPGDDTRDAVLSFLPASTRLLLDGLSDESSAQLVFSRVVLHGSVTLLWLWEGVLSLIHI